MGFVELRAQESSPSVDRHPGGLGWFFNALGFTTHTVLANNLGSAPL
jgi:hypothetical protein